MNRLAVDWKLRFSAVSGGGFALFGFLASAAWGEVTLPPIFSDHLVLQKSDHVPVWGHAAPGEMVRVAVAGASDEAKTAADGRWQAVLDLRDAAPGPFNLSVDGPNHLEIRDVLVGEVWSCSGQSNMAQKMRYLKTEKSLADIANSANTRLREFRVRTTLSPEPAEQCDGKWQIASPDTVPEFSAVGYYFARHLEHTLQAPVGLITNAVAGTPVEGWTSIEALQRDPELGSAATGLKRALHDFPGDRAAFEKAYTEWGKRYHREDRADDSNPADYAAPEITSAGWSAVKLPGTIGVIADGRAGAVWLRKKVNLPPALATGKDLDLHLGIPHEFETVYWNGALVGSKTLRDYPGSEAREVYAVPSRLIHPGENTLAVRLFNALETPGIGGFPRWLTVESIPLDGEWQAKAEFALPPLDDAAKASYPAGPKALPSMQRLPTLLFNGMVQPLIPFAIRGVLWYQGEDNVERAAQYRTAFPLLINDWRARWNRGELPFYFCQLANFKAKKELPGESDFAELRDAQARALSLPNTGQVVLIDVGERSRIHFARKEIAGERLAALALAGTCGREVPCKGPVYQAMTVEENRVRLRFDPGAAELVARPVPEEELVTAIPYKTAPLRRNSPHSQLEGFAICGEDHRWVWADARIDGATVVVSADSVPKPFAVRYAWADNPTCNLYNSAGFPASSFQTFDFPAVTAAARYH